MSNSVQSLTRTQCVGRLLAHGVGRVSLSVSALPVIVPVAYRVEGESLIFSALLDETLASSCHNAVIAFEVDECSAAGSSAWSVMVVGVASLLAPADGLTTGPANLRSPPDGDRRLLRLDLSRLSGLERASAVSHECAHREVTAGR